MECVITPLVAAEAIAILENTDTLLLAKIPTRLIESLQEKADELGKKVNLDYSKNFESQEISEQAKDIIALIYRDYWCTAEQREEINNALEANERKYNDEIREKYNPDNIFQKEEVTLKEKNLQEKNVSLIVKEDFKWYQKIFNKIKSLFSK